MAWPKLSPYNPFISYNFLHALEAFRLGHGPGRLAAPAWLAETADGAVLGAVPRYLKLHSRGEYVFDRGWAEAWRGCRRRVRHPKLQVQHSRRRRSGGLLVRPSPGADKVRDGLIAGLIELCHRHEASSVHFTFLPEPECQALVGHGFLQRTDQQFHWHNEGYAGFDAFPLALWARKRRPSSERRDAPPLHHGALAHRQDLTEEAWDAFFAFYMETGSRKRGSVPPSFRKFR